MLPPASPDADAEGPRLPRQYPAAYKLRILGEYEQLDKKGKGALLRRAAVTHRLLGREATQERARRPQVTLAWTGT